jgi:prepilin-type N-terminal cleavage/methylation domain-containing protein
MIRKQELSSRRGGFTLIELLVVIAIIAVLVSLTTAAVMQVMIKLPQTKTRVEIGQLEASILSFSQDHNGVIMPSTLILRENNVYPAGDPTGNFLRRAWGKNIGVGQTAGSPPVAGIDWNQNGVIDANPIVLTGSQCLVFYLGGTGGTHGFSNNNNNPMSAQGNPYFSFVASRLQQDPSAAANNSTQFPVYIDGYTPGKPYAYFSTSGVMNSYNYLDCSSIGAQPYYDTNPGNWVNPTSYQIISAGRNGIFGGLGSTNGAAWSSTSGTLDPNGRDDQANFSQRLLMAGAQ